ncbi:MAG: RES family NAD+ phosphorylase [Microvirga sp.]
MLHAGNAFEVALFEAVHQHGRFMARTHEPAGWTSRFREIVLTVDARLHDLRPDTEAPSIDLPSDDYHANQVLGAGLRLAGSDGVVHPSVRAPHGECVGLFHPDCAAHPVQGRHLDYHWNGTVIDFYRDLDTGQVYRIV